MRSELRRALLAAAEACWIYPALVVVGTPAGFAHEVSPLGIFLVYWAGLLAGRTLPRLRVPWRLAQALNILIALVVILLAVRVGLYENFPLLDLSWLSTHFARVLAFWQRMSAEELSTVALIYAFIRGLGFSQRPLTLWFVGFQFRLGIVVLFFTSIAAGLLGGVDFRLWIVVYFILSLLAIALARIEESGRELALGWKWGGVLLGAIGGTLALGYVLAQLFTLDVLNTVFEWLSPLFVLAYLLLALLAIPLAFIVEALLNLLLPLFGRLSDLLRNAFPAVTPGVSDAGRALGDAVQQLESFAPYLRLAGVILVVLLVGWLIARALDRRMYRQEEETFFREQLDERERLDLNGRRRARRARPVRREIQAENVRRIYAALLAQSEAVGLARRAAETPLEFLPRLAARFPLLADDLRAITDAYVAVHYAQRPVAEERVRELRAVWGRVRGRMRDEGGRRTKDEGRTRKTKD